MENMFNLILAIVFLSSTYISAIGDTRYETEQSTSTDTAAFKQAMQKAMEDQKQKIKKLRNVVFNLKAPVVPEAGDQLINDTVMFDVKQTLYKKFIDSPISQDPQFQGMLLILMNKSTISENDLKDLQKAANDAHDRLRK